jgi:hypothetical protein
VGTGMDAVSAAYAKIMVYGYLFPGAVVAVFYRARRDTGMTVNTFFLINSDDRRQFVCLHKQPPLNITIFHTIFYLNLYQDPGSRIPEYTAYGNLHLPYLFMNMVFLFSLRPLFGIIG